jgi:hypothetical protein
MARKKNNESKNESDEESSEDPIQPNQLKINLKSLNAQCFALSSLSLLLFSIYLYPFKDQYSLFFLHTSILS